MTQFRTLALAGCLAAFTGCNTKSMTAWMAESSWIRSSDPAEEVGAKPLDAAPLTLTPQTMSYSLTPLNKPGQPTHKIAAAPTPQPPPRPQTHQPRPVAVTYAPVQKQQEMTAVSATPPQSYTPPVFRSAQPPVQNASAGQHATVTPVSVTPVAVAANPAPAQPPAGLPAPTAAPAAPGGDIGIGTIAPDFTLKDLNGNYVSLSQYRGRPVVLTFWGVRCVPCRHEAPFMSSLQQKYLDRGLVVLGVDAQDSTPAEVRRFAQAKSLSHTLLTYGWEMFKKRYHGQGLPRCYVLDREGRVTARFDTYLPGDDKDIDAAVQRALGSDAGRPVAFNLGSGN